MFRDDFVWGVAASAYQIEGREEGDGAGKMIWDTFAEQGRIMDGYTADVTCESLGTTSLSRRPKVKFSFCPC